MMRVPRRRDLRTRRAQSPGTDQHQPDDGRGPLGRLIDVIANAAVAGWGPTVRTAFLLIVGSAAVALVLMAMGSGHL